MGFDATNIVSEAMGIGTLLKRYRLTVPPNQRSYSWDEEVGTLLKDLSGAIDNGDTYFLGTVVMTKSDGDATVYEIADGQQRIGTTLIMLAAIRDYFCTHDEPVLANSIENEFLFTVVRATKEIASRVLLNVTDREFFRRRILARPYEDARGIEPVMHSQRLIDEAAQKAALRVAEIVAGQKQQVAVDRLNEWAEFLEHHAQVIVVKAPDHLSAFTMFETLNDRGLETSQVDLIKNYLFQMAGDRLDEAQHKWALAMGNLETIDAKPITYARYLSILLYGPTLEKRVLHRVKEKVTSRQRAIEFLDKFNDNASTFVAINSPDHLKWNPYGGSTRRHLMTILDDLKIEQIMPLVMAVATTFSARETQKAFRMFVCWSVRFLIAGGRGGFLDKHYSAKAFQVGAGKIKTAADLANAMIDEEIVPPDAAFRNKFATATVSRAYLARYYLRALELKSKGDKEPELVPNPSEEVVNLEHILPQTPGSDWSMDEADLGMYRRIGNMVLLHATDNSQIGNQSFSVKRDTFKKSPFYLTSMVAREKTWGPEQIDKRQRALADLAVETWPIK